MLSRKIKETHRSCSSSPRKSRRCKDKKTSKPPVYIEEPRRVSIPLAISLYSHPPTTVQTLQKPRWVLRSKPTSTTTQPTVKKRKLYQWYKRKQALRKLKANDQREKKLAEKERKEAERRENQILKHFEEIEGKYLSSDTSSSNGKEDQFAKRTEKVKKEVLKAKKLYTKKSHVKPRAASRSVSVKEQENRYDEMSIRFVNCFYRFCCQLYCYLTCLLIIGFVVIVIV